MISSKTLSTFNPVLAETKQASSQGKPIVSSISFFVPSTFALGKSTLFITGIISKSLSSAKYTFARVCASTPWVESTTSKAPSHAARDLLTS